MERKLAQLEERLTNIEDRYTDLDGRLPEGWTKIRKETVWENINRNGIEYEV